MTLRLRREALSDLSPAELGSLAGASGDCTVAVCVPDVTAEVDELRQRVKDLTNFTRESGCTPRYGVA